MTKNVLSFLTATIFFMILFIRLLLAQFPVYAQNVLFQDNFNDGDAAGWEEYNPQGVWYVENGKYVGTAVTKGSNEQPSYSVTGNKAWQDYSFRVRIKGAEGIDKEILFRVNEQGKAYVLNLRSKFFGGGNDLVLAKKLQIGTGLAQLLHVVPYSNFPDIWYDIQVDVTNNESGVLIKVFINNSLILEYLDQNNPIPSGAIGFEIWPGGYSIPLVGLRTTTRYDDVFVTLSGQLPSPTPTALPSPTPASLNVPDLKQFSPSWGEDEYNNASTWYPDDPSIARWGCVVTSAAMVLQYYGHTTDPGGLDEWLSSEPDGYIRNGLTNWLAISRYTAIQNEVNSSYPILEYERFQGADTATLSAELRAGHPVILGEPGHFVTATGEQDSTFFINDPAYTDRPTLESYGNAFTSFSRYKPTATNLSAILLVVDGDTQISLFSPSGNPIKAISYLQEPLIDDVNGQATSGDILKIFLFQNPTIGVYLIEVEGAGSFQLDAYLYDEEGNLIEGSPQTSIGLVLEEKPASLYLNYDKDPNTPSIETETTFESTLQDLEISWFLDWISNEGIYQSLQSKLLAARKAAGSSKNKILKSFLNQLEALRSKKVTEDGFNFLYQDVSNLLLP